METTELTMKSLRAFWGRVIAVESPVDEATRDSGLIVPVTSQGIIRAVVQSLDEEWSDDDRQNAVQLVQPGTVIYFKADSATRISDVYVLELSQILAYEAN